jgi:hypothetical protein
MRDAETDLCVFVFAARRAGCSIPSQTLQTEKAKMSVSAFDTFCGCTFSLLIQWGNLHRSICRVL